MSTWACLVSNPHEVDGVEGNNNNVAPHFLGQSNTLGGILSAVAVRKKEVLIGKLASTVRKRFPHPLTHQLRGKVTRLRGGIRKDNGGGSINTISHSPAHHSHQLLSLKDGDLIGLAPLRATPLVLLGE